MSERIASAVRRDETIRRLGGHGDNWHSTWSAGGALFTSLSDGGGFPEETRRIYNSRVYRVTGHPESGVVFADVPGYPMLTGIPGSADDTEPRYYGFGIVEVGGVLYQFLSTMNAESWKSGELRFVGAKLISSADGGKTWRNQDGSSPVRWESWGEQAGSLIFFDEPDQCFSLTSVLQMGQGYDLNRDGFVYVFAPSGNVEGTMNQLVLCRVPVGCLEQRSAYEFFAGMTGGEPTWSAHIDEREAVLRFPSGWVNRLDHPYAWQPSVTYDPALGTYLMASWAPGVGSAGEWFARPSYLGFYEAPDPWGPWRQFHEETAWTPGGDEGARCYSPQIMPNWFSDDGLSFWLTWTDFQVRGEHTSIEASPGSTEEIIESLTRLMPYYSFNVQRVDLGLERRPVP